MSHFLLIYDRMKRRDPVIEEFKDADEAMARFRDAEQCLDAEHGAVLLFADDVKDIRATHGHYFASFDDLLVVG